MAAEVKSAQVTISEHWPEHVYHKTVGKAPRWDAELGVVCACEEVLGWPDPEHKETLSAYMKRVASERVDAASAPGRVKGAFGTYGGERPEPAAEGEGFRSEPDPGVQGPSAHDDDPGPDEPEPEVDWGEPPADEPEPEVLTIEDGDSEDVGTAPVPADAVPDERGNMISGGMSYGQADDAQTQSDLPPWNDPPEYKVGDQVTVGGMTFTKHSEWPFPEPGPGWNDGERTEKQEITDGSQAEYSGGEMFPEPDYDSPPWASAANLTPEEAAAASAEGAAAARELIDNPEVGRALVPYAGTPIMPTDGHGLDPLTGRLPPLDPTLPYTPEDVELKIVEIMRQLETSDLFLRQQLARLHQATHNHDFRYNLALAKSDQRAADQRKAEAWLATEQERHEMTEADMLVRALRDSQHNLRAQLSGFQSVARSLAVSMVNSLDGRERPPLPPEPPRWT